jgi:hypothetical protein
MSMMLTITKLSDEVSKVSLFSGLKTVFIYFLALTLAGSIDASEHE